LKLLPGNLEKIALALGAKDLVSLIKTIHSMRPHLSYMGMEEAAKMAAEMENFAHEGNRDSEVLDLAKTMVEHCEKSQVELEMLLPQIK
jgi:HPt (histidine-containing phosphotransfer) domain-containing protein